MSITEYNGCALVAMVGKDCVGIASDTLLSVQNQAIQANLQRVFKANKRTLYGLGGLATDVATFSQLVDQELNLFKLNENRDMRPSVFTSLVSGMLYARRFGPFFISPVICGLEEDKATPGKLKPFVSGMDLIGAKSNPSDFIVAGTAEDSLNGVAESFFRENMDQDELFEVLSQTLLSAVNRDCGSGWAGEVHILTPTEHIVRKLKMRSD